jgi:hypothetical protein
MGGNELIHTDFFNISLGQEWMRRLCKQVEHDRIGSLLMI